MSPRISQLLATENRRTAVIISLWTLAMTSTFAQALFQRAGLSLLDYGLLAAICFVAGMIIVDLGRALLSYVGTMAVTTVLLITLLSYPATTANLPSPGNLLFSTLWLIVVFTAVFPIPLITCLVTTVIGASVGERYF